MSVYPGATPPAGSASASDTLAAAGHTSLHNNDRDEIRALATKLGTGASTPTSGMLLRGNGVGTSVWGQANLTTDVTGVLPVASGGTGQATLTGLPLASPAISGTVSGGATYSSITLTTPVIASFVSANHNHQNAAGGGTLSESALDWSTFSLNMKSATNTGTTITNADQDLAAQGLTLSFTVASNCNALVSVDLGIVSSADFEFRPQIRVDGVTIASITPSAALGNASSRAIIRGFTYSIPLTAGSHTISAGVFISSGAGLSMIAGGGTISALVLGTVTA